MGCDVPCKPWYAILCPACNGTRIGSDGEECREPRCNSSGELRGYKSMDRCPGSMQTPNISRALRAYSFMKEHGILPVAGGMMDQACTYIDFVSEMDAALDEARKSVRD